MYFCFQLLEDPIFIPISQLEQDKDGKPEEFRIIETNMREGKVGSLLIEKAKDGQPRVSLLSKTGIQVYPRKDSCTKVLSKWWWKHEEIVKCI